MKFRKIKMTKSFVSLLVLSVFFLCSFVDDAHRVSIHMESQRLANGKVIKIVADIYFKYNEGALTIHYTHPNNYLLLTNSKGEIKVYDPKKNEVSVMQNQVFSSENDILYTFLTNRQNDMGLTEAGFSLTNSTIKNKMQITSWIPPVNKMGDISKIELVHEDYLPIYSAYYNINSKIFKKIYYSNYYFGSFSPIPQKIVEIDYTAKGDSIISRKIYTDIKVGNQCNSQYFDYSIPQDAKITTQK